MSINKQIENETLKQFATMLNIAEDELKKILSYYDKGQEELEQIIFDLYKNYGSADGEQFYNELKKYNRMSRLDKQIDEVTTTISTGEATLLTALLVKLTSDSYYRNAYILEKNLSINTNFKLLRNEIVQTLVDMPIEGLTFSERLYFNQIKLKQSVKSTLVDGITKGKDIKSMAKSLDEKMTIGRNNAMRICRTESARVWYEGQRELWQNTDVVEKLIYISVLDGKTSELCRERSGNIYIKGKEPELPAHPNCRSSYGVYFDDWENKKILDNQSKQQINYTTYEKWYKEKVK